MRAVRLGSDRTAQRAALRRFAGSRFLHQVRSNGTHPGGADDLAEALDGELPGIGEWRVHHHVPVDTETAGPLCPTQPVLLDTLAVLFGGSAARTRHVEVETYTWPVLPASPTETALVEGIAAELNWTRAALASLGLKELWL